MLPRKVDILDFCYYYNRLKFNTNEDHAIKSNGSCLLTTYMTYSTFPTNFMYARSITTFSALAFTRYLPYR